MGKYSLQDIISTIDKQFKNHRFMSTRIMSAITMLSLNAPSRWHEPSMSGRNCRGGRRGYDGFGGMSSLCKGREF